MSGYIGNIPTPQATQTRQTFTATAGQTSFATLGYTPNFVSVYLNGVKLIDGTDYTATNGSDIVLTSAAALNDTLEMVAFTTFEANSQNFTGDFSVDADTLYVDSTNDRVGVNTSSPSAPLDVVGSPGTLAEFRDGVAANFIVETSSNVTTIGNQAGSSILAFKSSNSEAMRIDTSGNVLVGKTSVNATDVGIVANASGRLFTVVNGDSNVFNRTTSDGAIVEFRKDGVDVGSIGANSGKLYISNDTGTGGLRFYNGGVNPCDASGNDSDNLRDLGKLSARWDDIYATNATIQTSDANEKQDIDVLSEAEQRVAVACKGLLRKFRWKSAIAEKGDDARIHFGIIAQDLQAAFEAEGLNAGDYAMFIHTTWTDEETGEEKSRMGVRYSELLAFIIAAI